MNKTYPLSQHPPAQSENKLSLHVAERPGDLSPEEWQVVASFMNDNIFEPHNCDMLASEKAAQILQSSLWSPSMRSQLLLAINHRAELIATGVLTYHSASFSDDAGISKGIQKYTNASEHLFISHVGVHKERQGQGIFKTGIYPAMQQIIQGVANWRKGIHALLNLPPDGSYAELWKRRGFTPLPPEVGVADPTLPHYIQKFESEITQAIYKELSEQHNG